MNNGGKKLIILGIASILIALITSGVSLAVYHNSGDIYLDRSRPGFLPDKEEKEEEKEKEEEYVFSDNGAITPEILEEYLKHYQEVINYTDNIRDPFSATPLSDSALGL